MYNKPIPRLDSNCGYNAVSILTRLRLMVTKKVEINETNVYNINRLYHLKWSKSDFLRMHQILTC